MSSQYLMNSCLNASNDGVLTTLLSSSKVIRLTDCRSQAHRGRGIALPDKDLSLGPNVATDCLGSHGHVSESAWASFSSPVKWAP